MNDKDGVKMSEFKKKFHIPCECFLPPVPPPQIGPTGPTGPSGSTGPTGPTGPTAVACCPCTNVLDNPGFDEPPLITDPVPGWNQVGDVTEVGVPNVHSGRILSDGTLSLLAVAIGPGGSINQLVDVDEGCCYTFSFAADVRDGAFPIASVSFPELVGHGCPPLASTLGALNIPHIIPVMNQPQSGFQHYVLVVCIPPGVTIACVAFQNIATGGEGATAFVDNVVFQPTGGPCTSCSQNF